MAAATLPLSYFSRVETRTNFYGLSSNRSFAGSPISSGLRTRPRMKFEDWEPHTLRSRILRLRPRERRRGGVGPCRAHDRDDLPVLTHLCRGRAVTVCGNAPSLIRELDRTEGSVLAADAAALVLQEHGIQPDAVFTDLDGADDRFIMMNLLGTIMVVHAHGDNIPLLRHWVPGSRAGRRDHPEPPPPARAQLRRLHRRRPCSLRRRRTRARKISIIGFDLDDRSVDPVKRGKLYWAGKLLSSSAMPADAVIIDGYVDEPACLGVPPYISPYIRTLQGSSPCTGTAYVISPSIG